VTYQFIHIGKTGGTLIREVLLSLPAEHRRRFRFHGHDVTLPQALEANPEMPVFFSVRRPESLFVSAFNSRRREGRPTYERPHNRQERIAFGLFDSPNELAESLSAAEPHLRACAEFSMLAINHVRKGLRWYLRDIECLDEHRDRIAFILLQERLEEDLSAFAARVGVPLEAAQVSPHERLHTAVEEDDLELSATGMSNIRAWYRPHQEIYDWCVAFHDRLVA
jgi:hypothetical protein